MRRKRYTKLASLRHVLGWHRKRYAARCLYCLKQRAYDDQQAAEFKRAGLITPSWTRIRQANDRCDPEPWL